MSAFRNWKKSLALVLVISLMIGILWTPALADAVISSDEIPGSNPDEIVTSLDDTELDDTSSETESPEPESGETTTDQATVGNEGSPLEGSTDGTTSPEETEDLPEEAEPGIEPSEAIPEVSEPVESTGPDESMESQEPTESEKPVESTAPVESSEPEAEATETLPEQTPEVGNEMPPYGDPGGFEDPGVEEDVPAPDPTPTPEPTPTPPLETGNACINGVFYATLQDAINAANAGDTVELLASVSENVVIDNRDIILDLNRRSIIGKTIGESVVVINGGTVTIQNGALTGAKAPEKENQFAIGPRGLTSTNAVVTLNNVGDSQQWC